MTGELGDPPRFTVERVVRQTFKVRLDFDGIAYDPDPGDGSGLSAYSVRKRAVRSFYTIAAAYKWVAWRMIFVRRDDYLGDAPNGCTLCEEKPVRGSWVGPEYGPPQCRYHDQDSIQRIVNRLARWLRWRDRRRVELVCAACSGSGEVPGADDHWLLCSACKGSGRRAELRR